MEAISLTGDLSSPCSDLTRDIRGSRHLLGAGHSSSSRAGAIESSPAPSPGAVEHPSRLQSRRNESRRSAQNWRRNPLNKYHQGINLFHPPCATADGDQRYQKDVQTSPRAHIPRHAESGGIMRVPARNGMHVKNVWRQPIWPMCPAQHADARRATLRRV